MKINESNFVLSYNFRPTVVHKFLIKNTIEESIYKATTSKADDWDKNKVTLRNLITLFKDIECLPSSEETFSETEDITEEFVE